MQGIIDQTKSMHLNKLDKMFLTIFSIVTVYLFFTGITVLTIGGLVLIYGAFLTYKGQIYLSVGTYLIADACWVYNAWENDDLKGVLMISVGIFFGILSTIKMRMGHMEKDLIKK